MLSLLERECMFRTLDENMAVSCRFWRGITTTVQFLAAEAYVVSIERDQRPHHTGSPAVVLLY